MRWQDDAALKGFLLKHEANRLEVKKLLRTRSFVGEKNSIIKKVINFLNEAGSQLQVFEGASDLAAKTDFLKSLVRAWEVADSTSTFNSSLKAYGGIKDFSATCVKKISSLSQESTVPATERVYWQEVARAGLIIAADDYRAQRLEKCRSELDKMLVFVNDRLKDETMRCDGILGQIFYFYSKANRMDGRLNTSEEDLIRAAEHYSHRAQQLARRASQIESALCRNAAEGLKAELDEVREKLMEVTLRTGVIEVSRAWLYFSQSNYKGAKHSAHTALLLLSTSSDELTQYHARLVSAAVDRVTSHTASELDETVSKLTEIRDYFRLKRHTRLQARAEYELLLALILLDSTLEIADRQAIRNKAPLKEAEKCLRHRTPHPAGRWESLKLTLRSRFLHHKEMKKDPSLRDFGDAIASAERALLIAEKTNNQYCKIEAKIACGEAYFEQGAARDWSGSNEKNSTATARRTSLAKGNEASQDESFALAKRNLSEALDLCLNANFPELTAIVRLLLARVAVRVNLYDEADYQLHEFRRIRIQEHAWVQRLHAKVFSEHQRQDALVLQEDQLTKKEAFLALKDFLINKAREKAKRERGKVTDKVVTDILGISRVTLSDWRSEIRKGRGVK